MPAAISIDDQIAEVGREISLRERVYPRWVGAAKLTPSTADKQMARIRAVLETLKRVKAQAEAVVPWGDH
jgi:hypothetical protein